MRSLGILFIFIYLRKTYSITYILVRVDL
uniref:Uncharacterized protein n=1 Tax=Rhizophora mucronata TaxID=61149 RepID=A0A2P2Q8U9_RHIMU